MLIANEYGNPSRFDTLVPFNFYQTDSFVSACDYCIMKIVLNTIIV